MATTDWKDATGRSLPDALDWVRLTGQVAIPVADSADSGVNPDMFEPVGRVVLSPSITETRFTGVAGVDPLLLALVDIPIRFNRAGQLFVNEGEAGLRVLNPCDPHLNPSGWHYVVNIEFEDVDDVVRPVVEPFAIQPPPPRGDGSHWTLDITELANAALVGELVSVEMARGLVAAAWGLVAEDKGHAEASRRAAEASAESARKSEQSAAQAASDLVEAKNQAAESKAASVRSEASSRRSAESAKTAEQHSADSLKAAEEAKNDAAKSRAAAEESKTAAERSEAKAVQAASDLAEAKTAVISAAGSAKQSEEEAKKAAASVEESKQLIATSPVEFKWETISEPGVSPKVRGWWRRTGETEWHDVGVINTGVDGNSVTGAKINKTGHLVLSMSRGESIDTGSAIGPRGLSISKAEIDEKFHLILTLDDGTRLDAGVSRGADGKPAPRVVSGTVDESTGQVTLVMDDSTTVPVSGSLTGPVGPAPVLEAAGVEVGDAWGVVLVEKTRGVYGLKFQAPVPAGVSRELVWDLVNKVTAERLETLDLFVKAAL